MCTGTRRTRIREPEPRPAPVLATSLALPPGVLDSGDDDRVFCHPADGRAAGSRGGRGHAPCRARGGWHRKAIYPSTTGVTPRSRSRRRPPSRVNPAGATGLEPATPGFGDRCATNCATPLGCGAQCTPTPLVTLCHEPCSATPWQPSSPPLRSLSGSSRCGPRSKADAHGSSPWRLQRSLSGSETSPGGSGQADRTIWPTGLDESGGRRRILLGW